MKTKTRQLCTAIAMATASLYGAHAAAIDVNYGKALQSSIYFYEAQQAGKLPSWNRVEWRGDSVLNDGADVGVDLSGGWFDAGDHVKFGFPMAASATVLAWGVLENPEAYEQTGQMVHIKNNLRFVADYFMAAHTAPNELYGQVGGGSADHSWWGAPEVITLTTRQASERPSFKIDASCPGSDLAGETAAALAALSMVFKDDAVYSARLLSHARDLYTFADTYRGKYSDCITDAVAFYNSWSGYNDELVWSAAWMHKATGEQIYLNNARAAYENLSTEAQSEEKSYKWTHAWDDKAYGSYVLMATLTDDPEYKADAERYLDFWTTGYNGDRVDYTPGGQAQLSQWGSNRYSANTAFVALVYSDYLKAKEPSNSRISTYYDFAVGQIEYIMGDNPNGIPYQIGYNENSPKNPHHRGAHGSWADSSDIPEQSRHLLIGALVGGPKDGDGFIDDRNDFITNEVATDYNAGFTGALARLYTDFGGSPTPEAQFPPKETRDEEYFVEAKLNASGSNFVEIAAVAHNRSAWPASNGDDISYRYFIDLSAEIADGYSPSDIRINTNYNQANEVSGLQQWGDPADNIYYVEIDFDGIDFFPGGRGESKRETQFRIALNGNTSNWVNSGDPSWDGYTGTLQRAPKLAMYKAGELVFGSEPSPGCGDQTGINCLPMASDINTNTPNATNVGIALSAQDSDGTITGYTVSQPANGSVAGFGASRTYTPNTNFEGIDTFTYTATDNSGGISAPATVSVTVDAPIVPMVSISSPTDNSNVTVGSNVNIRFALDNASAVNVFVNGGQVASNLTESEVSIQAPDNEGAFLVEIVALDENGDTLDAATSITLNAVAEQANSAPVSTFTISTSGLSVSVDASNSSDNEGDNLTYAWLFGSVNQAGVTTSYTFDAAGTYDVTLTVSDGELSSSTTQSVTVTAPGSGSGSGSGVCTFTPTSEWNTGFVGNIAITNEGTEDINGWALSFTLPTGYEVTDSWNANITGTNAVIGTPVSWNAVVKPGQTRDFGVKGSKPSGVSLPTINVMGNACQ